MRNLIGFAVLVLLFFSCGGNKEQSEMVSLDKPADLIPEDKMILVLADVHLLEGAVAYRTPHGTSRTPFMISPTEQAEIPQTLDQKAMPYYDIFAKYGFTRDQYDRSVQWYTNDPEHYSEMYDEVISELTRRQAAEQQGGPVQPANDSTKK